MELVKIFQGSSVCRKQLESYVCANLISKREVTFITDIIIVILLLFQSSVCKAADCSLVSVLSNLVEWSSFSKKRILEEYITLMDWRNWIWFSINCLFVSKNLLFN